MFQDQLEWCLLGHPVPAKKKTKKRKRKKKTSNTLSTRGHVAGRAYRQR